MSRIVNLALNAADHLASKGRLDAAASILRNYLSTNSADGTVLQRLGRIYLKQGRSEEAVHLLQQALICFQNESSVATATATVGDMTFDPCQTQTSIDERFIAAH